MALFLTPNFWSCGRLLFGVGVFGRLLFGMGKFGSLQGCVRVAPHLGMFGRLLGCVRVASQRVANPVGC